MPKYDTSVALTVYGTANGTGTGITPTSPGNVYVSTYTGASSQLWTFNPIENAPSSFQYMFKSPEMQTYISNPYGWRGNEFHKGIDITTGIPGEIEDYPVYCVLNGIIIKYGYFSDNITTCSAITHTNGQTTRSIHIKLSETLFVNNFINTGTKIGTVSNKGCGPNNYHLHFDVNTINTSDGTILNSSNTIDPATLFPNIF